MNPNIKTGVIAAIVALVVGLLMGGGTIRFGSSGISHFNGVESDTGYTDIASAASSLLGTLSLSGGVVYGNTLSTTTSGSETIKVSDVKGYDTIILTPTVASPTVTFFASSTASAWLPTAGNMQNTCFVNGTTTANVYITFAGGTGTNLQVASSSATALGSTKLAPQKVGCFHFVRANSTPTTFDIQGAYTAYQ